MIKKKQSPIYFDYAATTPVDPKVAEVMAQCLQTSGVFGNPTSLHAHGRHAATLVQNAREQLAALLNCEPKAIIWTSGATESINLALKGAAKFYQSRGKHIITMATEHKAVLDSCNALEESGFRVTYLKPKATGLLDLNDLEAAISEDTILVSIMHVNNETGVVQDVESVAKLTRAKNILFHVDAAQSVGKLPLDLTEIPIDFLSLSSHKIYGPKGIGALYVCRRPRARCYPLIHGGGHELGLRSGTLATHQIVGFGQACNIALHTMESEARRIRHLRDKLWAGLSKISGIHYHGDVNNTLPGILNISIEDQDSENLLIQLDDDLSISSGSACTSATKEVSHVLRAMGISDDLGFSSLRISLGRFSTEAEVDEAIRLINQTISAP